MARTPVNAEAELNELNDLKVLVYVDGKPKYNFDADLDLTVDEDDDVHNTSAREAISVIIRQNSRIRKDPSKFKMIVRSAAGKNIVLADDDVVKCHSKILASDGSCVILTDDLTDSQTLGINCGSLNLKKKEGKQ